MSVKAFNDDKQNAVDDKRYCNGDVVVKIFVENIIKKKSDYSGRDRADKDLEPKFNNSRLDGNFALAVIKLFLLERPELIPEHYYNGNDRTELDNDKVHFKKVRRNLLEFAQLLKKDHMTGTAYRQPLGDSFDYAEQY